MMYDIPAVKAAVDFVDLISPDTVLSGGPPEYKGPCPKCGGDDRFHVHIHKGWFCRQCTGEPDGVTGHWHDQIDYIMWRDGTDWATAYNKLGGVTELPPAERNQLVEQRRQAEIERQRKQTQERNKRRNDLDQSQIWNEYHQNLNNLDKRHLWYERGLSDYWIDYYKVGYCPEFTYKRGDTLLTAETLTIPFFTPFFETASIAPDDPGGQIQRWKCTNLVHRIIGASSDKYRPHTSGLGKSLFCCDLFGSEISGDILLVEGEIKAMVTFAHIAELLPTIGVVGLSGKSFRPDLASDLKQAGRIWICLDPDADHEANRISEMLNPGRCRIIDLPDKIDDMLNEGTLTGQDISDLMRFARRA